jgi:beta-alanine--pyruvate transaminase
MLFSFAGKPGIADVRGMGLVGAIELEPQGPQGTAAGNAFVAAWQAGVMGRYTGDTLAFSPPLIIEEEHIERIRLVFEEVLAEQYDW